VFGWCGVDRDDVGRGAGGDLSATQFVRPDRSRRSGRVVSRGLAHSNRPFSPLLNIVVPAKHAGFVVDLWSVSRTVPVDRM